jgi:hypothetical protein
MRGARLFPGRSLAAMAGTKSNSKSKNKEQKTLSTVHWVTVRWERLFVCPLSGLRQGQGQHDERKAEVE